MKILFKEELPKVNFNVNTIPNLYEVFIYGQNEIVNFWSDYDNKRPEPIIEVEAVLVGRLKVGKDNKEYNNLTLKLIKKRFIYEQYNESN